jgi:hypothetical protein
MQAAQRVISLSLMFTLACINDPITGVAGQPDAGTTPGGAAADALVREWSGCMTLDNFKLAGMATAWGGLAASNGQACSSCHGTGLQGFYADRDDVAMFTAISTIKGFLVMFFSPDVANNKMIVNETIFLAVAAGQPPFAGHPPFEPRNNAGMMALRSFHSATLAQQQGHTCAPPRLP